MLELSGAPTTDLFAEMDEIADDLRRNPRYVDGDLAIAFRDLQKHRQPDLSKDKAEFFNLFAVWRDQDRARQETKGAERRERFAQLCAERDALFSERAALPPQQHAPVTARLFEIGRELAEFSTPIEPPPSGEWV